MCKEKVKNLDGIYPDCSNCEYFDCLTDENGMYKPICIKGHDGIDERTPICEDFEWWKIRWRVEKQEYASIGSV